jgi:predicted phage tail protein
VIVAVYLGDPYYATSRSLTTQVITAPRPSVSLLHVKVSRSGRLTLTFTMSEKANVTVTVSRVVAGRRIRRRCRTNAKQGKRCTILVRKARLRLSGRGGRNSFNLKMRPLAPGQYTLTLTAVDVAGAHSKTYTIKFKVPPRRRHR